MKVSMVTGSRSWPYPERIHRVLEGSEIVFVGCCPDGADKHALDWCIANDCIVRVYCASSANFRRIPRKANVTALLVPGCEKGFNGPVRNGGMAMAVAEAQRALETPIDCHAFPGIVSPGTWDCVRKLREAGFDPTIHPLKE